MSVYVDGAQNQYGYMKMCHMIADTNEELHAMADKIGIQRRWFQNTSMPHYDICQSKKVLAIEHGAIPIDNRKLVEIMRSRRQVFG